MLAVSSGVRPTNADFQQFRLIGVIAGERIFMAGYRQSRINETLTHSIAEGVRQLKDPVITDSFVSITDVSCARDLKTANVYFSFLSKVYTEKEVRASLKKAAGFLRTYIARNVNLRETPTLNFVFDSSLERGNRISEILSSITFSEDNEKNSDKVSEAEKDGCEENGDERG